MVEAKKDNKINNVHDISSIDLSKSDLLIHIILHHLYEL